VRRYLKLNNLELPMSIGCLPEEREIKQTVSFSLVIAFIGEQEGERSDDLIGVVSYADLAAIIERVSQYRHFNLIENLANSVFVKLKEFLPSCALLELTINKVKPPVADLKGGASYTITELT
jgi:dihydroneopterin aldolase